jgi:inner membrane protein
MASLITHPVVPLALAVAVGRGVISVPLLVLGMAFSMFPDLDGVTFRLGIPYGSPFGHRGFTHSIAVALLLASMVMPLSRALKAAPLTVFCFLAVAMVSHGILDAFTNGGYGVAFLWPFSAERIFFDFRPIEASPVSLHRFMSARGLHVLESELIWVWMPALALGVVGWCFRRILRAGKHRYSADAGFAE